MKNINTIQIVDSLAEITRHHDREIIEKSLLKTLSDLNNSQEFRLYKIIRTKPTITIGLLAFSINGSVEIARRHTKEHVIPNSLKKNIEAAIRLGNIEQVSNTEGKTTHYIYPAFDHNNEVFSILIQDCNENHNYNDLRLVHSLLKVYSNYLELIEYNKRDKLTQLLNRETLDNEITRLLINNNEKNRHGVRRVKDPIGFWLGIIDIDHFKSVNDKYGHLFGDEVLILVARQMKSDIRGDEDLIYRYGGEEFVILLQAKEMNEALVAFNRLRKNVAKQELPQLGHITISIGVVQVTDQPSSIKVIGNADQALYYAKQHGRNQVCIYEKLIEDGSIEYKDDNIETREIEFF